MNLPINVFGNSSNISENKIDTSLFVQKTYLITKYIESNLEEDIEKKHQCRNKKLSDPLNIRQAASKNMLFFTAHVDFTDKNLENIRFIKVNSLPGILEHLTAKYYVDQAISKSVDAPMLVRNNEDKDCKNFDLPNINIFTMNTQAVSDNQVITKAYVDQFHKDQR